MNCEMSKERRSHQTTIDTVYHHHRTPLSLLSRRSLSLTFMIASPSLFSPHLLRLSRAFAAANPMPQIRSVGDAYTMDMIRDAHFPIGDDCREVLCTHLDKFPLASFKKHLRKVRVALAFGKLMPIPLFYNSTLV